MDICHPPSVMSSFPNRIAPSISDVKHVILACHPFPTLMEATLVTLSFNQTSMIPLFVAVKMKSLLTAIR
ncbi:hypothetical protein NC652_014900 [Populus alba x Populus x berolinensis]|nr:hypothetical protein NC652_014900 [Populus alba x Populus x berolinensis]